MQGSNGSHDQLTRTGGEQFVGGDNDHVPLHCARVPRVTLPDWQQYPKSCVASFAGLNLPGSFIMTPLFLVMTPLSLGTPALPVPPPAGPVESIGGGTMTIVVLSCGEAPCRLTVNVKVVGFATDRGTHPPFGEDGCASPGWMTARSAFRAVKHTFVLPPGACTVAGSA